MYHGLSLLEERDLDNTTVLRRFYAGGHVDVANGGIRYAYTTDHLGSIREVMQLDGTTGNPTTATLAARYDYDLWGKRTVLDGGSAAETLVMHGYTGHVRHQWSGLWLAPYRAYNSGLGRWISRDPIAEDGGINLYGYVLNAPVHFIDPLGLDVWDHLPPGVVDFIGSDGVNNAVDGMAGAADNFSFGLGPWLRDRAGDKGWIDPGVINPNSPAYRLGDGAADAAGAAKGAAKKAGKTLCAAFGKGGKNLKPKLPSLPTPPKRPLPWKGRKPTNKEAKDAANANGWKPAPDVINQKYPHLPVFTDGKRYFSPDVNGHIGAAWKILDGSGARIGTADMGGTLIGP